MKSFDVIIIGGGPSGIITGVTGKKQNPDKSFLMIKKDEKGLVPCGIPYIFHDLKDVSENMMGPKPFVDAGGEVLVDTVNKVDAEKKTVSTEKTGEIQYGKLVFATGSNPLIPTFIRGYDLEGVSYINKDYDYIEKLKAKTDSIKDIVVIGGGFIGVEVAEQLAKHSNKNVSLVEMEKYCLYRAFSEDVASRADEILRATNIKLFTGTKVQEIKGKNGKVDRVLLSDGSEIKAEMVICSIGYIPNTKLAQEAGLQMNDNNAILVDRYMRTNIKDVYAVGDCAGTRGFITGGSDNVMLASTATAEARILGYNLFNINLIRNFQGTLAVFSTEINGRAFASAGAIEQAAINSNISFITGEFQDVDRHPGKLPGTMKLYIKLIVSPQNGIIIGGELCGGKSVGELINVIGLAIQKRVTVYELISFQMGTHPLLTTAPTKYVLIKAAENAIAKIKKC
ncbi:MAG: FAD-dependent oxidoreductase [Candidatus Cloacimonetes bacterium]|nr:FAD-dependent oxidoreductase [Candidatus Cloacimonadota bacterium]MCF7813896.1 FAD-dependent oxidoreductase [Candidatus Cloacimonadota bacterium]MCF7868893.1 FAD-dependent oxidoreductase [Candidatus Cloacimonadota bacterium]MCF7884008.1 FAD-dependent oxidoreductase [Candidatus Cloacimonadota bacterium]